MHHRIVNKIKLKSSVHFPCSKRRTDERKTDTMRLGNNVAGNTHMNTEFDNPAFDEDSIYDSISRARGISMAENLEQASNGALQENDTRKGITNNAPCDDRTYQALDKTAVTSPAYTVASSGGRRIEIPEKGYASLQQKNEQGSKGHPGQGRRIDEPEKRYAALQQKKEHPGRGGWSSQSATKSPQHTSGTATDEDIYENLQCNDESGA